MILHHLRHFLASGPFSGVDHNVAGFFHVHITTGWLGDLMLALSEPGSALCVAIVLSLAVAYLLWRRHWRGLMLLVLTVPGGLLLNSAIKILVHRHRPFSTGPFAQWDGYSFPSGHTIGATLLYGTLLLALLPLIRGRHWKALALLSGGLLMGLVGFSRIALGAHYLTDVVGAMILGGAWLALCRAGFFLIGRRRLRVAPAALPTGEPDAIQIKCDDPSRLAA